MNSPVANDVYPGPNVLDFAIKESPFSLSTLPSLSLSDIINIPEDDIGLAARPLVALGAPQISRANAMSLGFILSDRLSNNITSTSIGTQLSLSASSSTSADNNHWQRSSGRNGSVDSQVRGWAPMDPDHYTLVDTLELPVSAPVPHISGRACVAHIPGPSCIPDVCLPWNQQGGSTPADVSPDQVHVQVGLGLSAAPIGTAAGLEKSQPDVFLDSCLELEPSPEPMLQFPALTRVPRCLVSTRASCPTLSHVPVSTPLPLVGAALPSRPAPGQVPSGTELPRTIPPPPRGGVSPAVARSITNIRLAREHAVQAYAARPRAEGTTATESDAASRTPSVLGRWTKDLRVSPAGEGEEGSRH
ncbi:hypothetical protein EVJ58_g6865 [Rhodofomes roseus]|uniref:Uncharacterized protein n=1 Tax=Rhodofomes roseus TaxID=34475 RepID=A0A4Y9Y6M6_9APHY|nr:hypothetical protein EVJ58_g6865 [Rhodofomes roseus]